MEAFPSFRWFLAILIIPWHLSNLTLASCGVSPCVSVFKFPFSYKNTSHTRFSPTLSPQPSMISSELDYIWKYPISNKVTFIGSWVDVNFGGRLFNPLQPPRPHMIWLLLLFGPSCLLTFPLFPLFQPYWVSSGSLNTPNMCLPQDLCTNYFCLESPPLWYFQGLLSHSIQISIEIEIRLMPLSLSISIPCCIIILHCTYLYLHIYYILSCVIIFACLPS